jgi:antitoxin (DNA-binding transcriptional repressor) of toxin-antitoxin stability system
MGKLKMNFLKSHEFGLIFGGMLMETIINTKELRATLSKIVERIRLGEQFTVLYRSRPAFRIVPVDEKNHMTIPLEKDPLYRARALGASSDGLNSESHNVFLYGDDAT